MKTLVSFVVVIFLGAWAVSADEAPISGTVKAVDPAARTLTVEVAGPGQPREVVVHMKPGAKVVRFTRATEPGKAGFVEQDVPLAEVKPGWVISADTRHEGNREVAGQVKIVFEP